MRPHWGLRFTLLFIAILFISGGALGYKVLSASNKISTAERSILAQVKDLLFTGSQVLRGEKEDRINILLMAIGGEGHSGENLADTVMFVSIRPSDHNVALLSIPRDLYVEVPHENYYSKLNAVHAYGEAKKKDGGPQLMVEKIEDITGQKVHYFGRVDFTAFKNMVDAVGGVEISIPNTFVDYWHKITFPAGTEKMNGERALAFARARYVEGPEGGDFKRTARQQQLLLAIRDKVFSVNTAFDFTRVNSVLNSLSNNIRTDMQLWEMKRFFEIARQISDEKVRSIVLATGNNGVLVGTTEVLGGQPASVLRTRTGDYSEIQQIAGNMLSGQIGHSFAPPAPQSENTATPAPSPASKEAVPFSIEIRNGTNTAGLAKKTQDTLQAKEYEVSAIGNAKNRATEKTTVFALSSEFADQAKEVARVLNAQTDSGLPEGEAATDAHIGPLPRQMPAGLCRAADAQTQVILH
ncbi:MAG: LCP family protein [Candidatus Sungbacteria bacterium]|nr:LCP family protein [Candidatus Sungbacteria bacterium]